MRYRDIASIALAAMITIWLGLYGKASLESFLYNSRAINREDARNVLATLITREEWVDFQILNNATTVRLLTNAAMQSMDAPDHDLTNPRLGWRYTLEYQLLDSSRNVVDAADYHFRSQIRQLKDANTGQAIYPIFLGKSGLVSAQTRPMQLAIDHFPTRPVILRVRLKSADAGIKEVVGRSLSRIERTDFDKRYTWNRLSQPRRELICRYTVYEPELLTSGERTNLLRWRWAQTATISNSPQRDLFFIGGFDDQEIRDEQLPSGLFTDPNWLATVPIPEGDGQVRLEFTAVDPLPEATPELNIGWYGIGPKDRLVKKHPLVNETTSLTIDLNGGLIQLQSPVRVVTRVFWSLKPSTGDDSEGEIEITPLPILAKAFVIDAQPIEYRISHLNNQPTPLRLSLRYPFGPNFTNITIQSTDDPIAQNIGVVRANWEFLDAGGDVVQSGVLTLDPVVSQYDNLELVTGSEWLSEKQEYFFSVPADVKRVRVFSPDCRLLVNAAVRSLQLSRITQVPEDYHAYYRRTSLNRTWYALNPPNDQELIQANRTFILRTSTRPPENDEDIAAGNYQWQRFRPSGQWIGRQMLVQQAAEINVRDRALASVYFELKQSAIYDFSSFHAAATRLPVRLIVISPEGPGKVTLSVNKEEVVSKDIRSARGEIDLSNVILPVSGSVSVASDYPARFFLSGCDVAGAERYLKRTAQRLGKSSLSFEYEKKSHEEELLTMQMYRRQSDDDRCQLRVTIAPLTGSSPAAAGPAVGWTTLNRTYDLRPHGEQSSLLIGDDSKVDVGHRCFIRLGKELMPGKYKIHVERIDDGPEGYVLMYQTLPGQRPPRSINLNAVPKGKHER